MNKHTIEVELRYKVQNPDKLIQKLNELGVTQANSEHQIVHWFMPRGIRSLAEEKQWFDEDHGVAWRIRRTEQAGGSFGLEVSSKQLTADNNHNTFIEHEVEVENYDEALKLMAEKGYYNWLTIDKTRYCFESGHDDMEVVLDVIDGLAEKIGVGACLEVEFKGSATRDEALQRLTDFAKKLGLNPSDQFEQSLTVEAMETLGQFED